MVGLRVQLYITLMLLAAYVVTLAAYPAVSSWVGLVLIVVCLGMAFYFIVQNHWHAFVLGRISGSKFVRNVLVDLLGLCLTIAAASYLGRLAGNWLGASFGIWVGLIAGLASAFLVAWGMRRLWGKVIGIVMG